MANMKSKRFVIVREYGNDQVMNYPFTAYSEGEAVEEYAKHLNVAGGPAGGIWTLWGEDKDGKAERALITRREIK